MATSSARGIIFHPSPKKQARIAACTGYRPTQGITRIVLRPGLVLPYSKELRPLGPTLLNDMDVSGTIGAILTQKRKEVYSIPPGATVFEAIEMMDAKNVGALLVMEGDRLKGVISERDYTRKVVLRGKRSREAKVAEIMSTNVFTTHSREGVDECLRIMTDKHIRHLPVLDGDKVVGVISIGDLVKHVISCQQAAIAHLENYIHGGYLG